MAEDALRTSDSKLLERMPPNSTSKSETEHVLPRTLPLATIKSRGSPISRSLNAEEDRLATFVDWPSNSISPEELAANGFYYTGLNDLARCAFCGLEVAQWEEGDSVSDDHNRFSPDCDFLRGRPCGNISLGSPSSSSASSVSSSPPSYDTCGPFGHILKPFSGPERGSLLKDLEHLGVSKTSGPTNPKYATEEARLRTYENWPESCPMKPEALAEAGFYSTGTEDHAMCFYCGGGLRSWEKDDDPWVEHARWFSRCNYVLMTKGRDYVASVQQNKPAILSAQEVNDLLEQQAGASEESSECTSEATPLSSSQTSEPEKSVDDDAQSLGDMEVCKICYVKKRSIVFLPCGHFVSCAMCAAALSTCPVCRQPFEATVRAYLS